MYQISERPCPKCFRTLRIKTNAIGLYCPDTLNCGWQTSAGRSTKRVSKEHLEHHLKKALEDNDRPRIRRIKTLLNRHYPNHLDVHPVS